MALDSKPRPGGDDEHSKAPSSKNAKKQSQGQSVWMKPSDEQSMAPKHKGSEPAHGNHPSTPVKPQNTPFSASKTELDGHKPKKSKSRNAKPGNLERHNPTADIPHGDEGLVGGEASSNIIGVN